MSQPEEVTRAFLSFYKELLGSRRAARPIEVVIIKKGKKLSEEQKRTLHMNFGADEIKYALFSIPDEKSPSIDGFSNHFYKNAWEIVGEDIIDAIQDFFRHGKLVKEINITAITLVPKVKCPPSVGDYRPSA